MPWPENVIKRMSIRVLFRSRHHIWCVGGFSVVWSKRKKIVLRLNDGDSEKCLIRSLRIGKYQQSLKGVFFYLWKISVLSSYFFLT